MAEPDQSTSTHKLAAIESEVEARSAVFKKELGLFDLVLTQVVFVVGTVWVGWAAKLAFNDFVAFMVAWNLWVFGILVMSGIGLIIKKNIAYAIGPRADWMHENKWMTTLVCVLLIVFIVTASRRGLALGKWVQNFGGAMLIITFATLILLPFITAGRGTLANYHPFSLSFPQLSTYNINVCSKLAVGALSGFEYIAIR